MGELSFLFSLDLARKRLVPEAEGLDGRWRGPRPLASLYVDRHLARLRPKLTFRKVVCLLAQFRRLKGRPDEQKLILEALASDFTLEYEFLTVISEARKPPAFGRMEVRLIYDYDLYLYMIYLEAICHLFWMNHVVLSFKTRC